jgi:hypothetical protein
MLSNEPEDVIHGGDDFHKPYCEIGMKSEPATSQDDV